MTAPTVTGDTKPSCACCGRTGPTPFECAGDCACALCGNCAAQTHSSPKATGQYIVLVEGDHFV